MDFSLSEEQCLLRDSLQRFLGRQQPTATADRHDRPDPRRWQRMLEELGLGMLAPAAGAGPMHVEHGLVLEALGHWLAPEPFFEAMVVAGHLLSLSDCARASELSAELAGGAAVPVLAWAEEGTRFDFRAIAVQARWRAGGWYLDGCKCSVQAAPWASHFIVAARTSGITGDSTGLSLFLVPAAARGLRLSPYPTVDGRCAGELGMDGVQAELLGEADRALDLLEHVRDIAVAAACAEAYGVLRQLLKHTVEYCRQRNQFGQPLAAFQVLQHRMVEMHLHVLRAESSALLATLNLARPEHRRHAVSSAQLVTASACRFVGQSAIQLHGGMGMSDEVQVSRLFKRATMLERVFGDRNFHAGRLAALAV